MHPEDGPDLGDVFGLTVEYLPAFLDQVAGRLGVLDVLDGPGVGAVGAIATSASTARSSRRYL